MCCQFFIDYMQHVNRRRVLYSRFPFTDYPHWNERAERQPITVFLCLRNKYKNIHTYLVQRYVTQPSFHRIHRWRVVSPRGVLYRSKQQLACGSVPNKLNHVRTVLPDMMCAVVFHWLPLERSYTEKILKILVYCLSGNKRIEHICAT